MTSSISMSASIMSASTKCTYLLGGLALLVTFAGCYHARVETGLTPSAQVIDRSFAASWIHGLVPPSTVAAGQLCSNGVAVVETQLSFVNQLVGFLTLGIYTPMRIRVTCAAGGMGMDDGAGERLQVTSTADRDQVLEIFGRAADRTVEKQRPVFVQFGP